MRMYQVDAFTAQPFAGNPAAVLVLPTWPSAALMQCIAAENNLAETAYACPRSDGAWDLRWFSPTQEVDFCGHATLATAHILYTVHGLQGEAVFHTRAGVLRVQRAGAGYAMQLPRLQPQPLAQLPAAIAPLFAAQPPVAVFADAANCYVDMGSAAAVRAFVPDMAAIAQLGSTGLVVTGVGGPAASGDVAPDASVPDAAADFVSRSFAPGVGIPEDPVTGSTHCTLMPYWAQQLGRTQLLAYQASARGGWIRCTLQAAHVVLQGDAVTFMQAQLAPLGGAQGQ